MPGFFYKLGKSLGPHVRKGNWVLQALTGEDADVIAAEYKVGRDLAAGVRESMGVVDAADDPGERAWLDALGGELSARVKDRRRRFTFAAIATGAPNAFALPGGFIFIERSLLDLCQRDRDEVGFVLAHEMAHVLRGHAMERLLGSDLIASAAQVVRAPGPYGILIRQAAAQFLQTAYSREQEFDADSLGLRLASASGLDPSGGPRLLSRLLAFSRTPDASDLGAYLSTHPPIEERVRRLRGMIGTT